MSLKKAYLYLVSTISLVIAVIGAIMIINLGLKAWVFTKADQNYYSYPCTQPVADPSGKTIACDQATIDAQKKQAEDNQTSQRQNTAAQAIAMIVVASPVWWFHWRMARKEA